MSATSGEVTPERVIEQLSQALDRLEDLLRKEVHLLETMRAGEIEALLSDKKAAVKAYREIMVQLTEQPELLNALDGRRKAELKAAAQGLTGAMEANARALRAGIEANGRLVKAIATAARAEAPGGERYLRDGRLTEMASAGAPFAVSVNQVL